MRVGGFVTGVFVLAGLEVVTSSAGAANRTAAIPTGVAGLLRRFMDPDLALLPNWHDTGASAPPIHRGPASDQQKAAAAADKPQTPGSGPAKARL